MPDEQPIVAFEVGQIVFWTGWKSLDHRDPIEIISLRQNGFDGRDIVSGKLHKLIYTHPDYHWFLVEKSSITLPEELID